MKLENTDALYKILYVYGPYTRPKTALKTSLCRIGWLIVMWPFLWLLTLCVTLFLLIVMTVGMCAIWLWQTILCARRGTNPFPAVFALAKSLWYSSTIDAPSPSEYAQSFDDREWWPSVFNAKVRPWFAVLALTVIFVIGKNVVEFAIFAPMTTLGFVVVCCVILFVVYHQFHETKTGLIFTEMAKGFKGRFCPIIEIAPYTTDRATE